MGLTETTSILLGTSIIILAILYRFTSLLITIFKNSKCTLKETATIIKFEKRVVSYKKFKQSMKIIVYTPIYQYEVKGSIYTFKGSQEKEISKQIGHEEYVFYDPKKPSRIIQQNDNMSRILFGFAIWILLGLSFILYGIIANL